MTKFVSKSTSIFQSSNIDLIEREAAAKKKSHEEEIAALKSKLSQVSQFNDSGMSCVNWVERFCWRRVVFKNSESMLDCYYRRKFTERKAFLQKSLL